MNTLHAVPARGDKCINGAVIIDIKRAWDESGYIALCLWTHDTQQPDVIVRTADPYVTWFVRPEGEGIRCYQGHYYDLLSDAVVDFTNRI